ncbi:hypothetical protein Tco_0200696 [Tanacetum coccineum]
MISLLRNKPGMKEEDVATLCGMDASPGPSTPQKSFSRELFRTQVILRELLHDQVILRDLHRISEWQSAQIMERHPENHTLESAGILHEIYQGMRNLNME